MTLPQPDGLRAFFSSYAAAALGPEPEKLAAFYGDSFLVAGPQGSAAFKNDDQFLGWLRQVHEFNQASGMEAMEVIAVAGQPLSDQFLIATVEWGAMFKKTCDERITFKISYILQEQDGSFKVLGYISHEDQMEAMREKGLL